MYPIRESCVCLTTEIEKKIGFWSSWENSKIYVGIAVHEQYSLLDTIYNYIFHFGPPGKHLYLSPQNSLHVGRSRFSLLFYICFPGGPK